MNELSIIVNAVIVLIDIVLIVLVIRGWNH